MQDAIKPGLYHDLSNDAYHSSNGVSKSQLDWIEKSPSLLAWSKAAPVDQEKMKALDMGTALHSTLLEPHLFNSQFIVAPEFNRRTNDGKAAETAFLADCAMSGKTVITAEEGRKLKIMRESVMAHPVARWIFEQEGTNESSIYWNDESTGELCKCRPDRMLNTHPFVIDVKKVDGMGRFETHVEEFRYHVQDAFYSEGFRQHFGEKPTFLFLCVSSTVGAGRYEVDVVQLPEEWREAGELRFRENLDTYHRCKEQNDWMHIRTLKRPYWASRGE
jgi:exodeoxyribonuclease VIII